MTKFSLHSVSLAAFGGVTALMITLSAAVPADAATGRSKFQASPEELRRHCWRIDETFWKSKRRYGCGEVVRCAEGMCVKIAEPPPPPTYDPPTVFFKREPGKNGDGGNGGARDGGNRDSGKKGGSSSSAAGGPNGPN